MQIITSTQLKEKLDDGEKIYLVDVREPDEHAEFNIGGMLIPLGNILAMQVEEIEDHKNDEIICYCRSGNRSMQATMMLETFGFTNVKNLTGGMLEWKEKYSR